MRKAFIDTLIELAENDEAIYLLTADMGFGLVEPFADRFPKRFINMGVAEQNMIGVATGLSLEGKKVFCYSIANFPTLRCLEQIRNDVCYHDLPVCIVSGGAGLWYGPLGMTHHAVEDIAVMRCLPNMAVVSPADTMEMGSLIKDIVDRGRPCYIRMSRVGDYTAPYIPEFGEPTMVLYTPNNPRVTVLATGGQMVDTASQAARILRDKGILMHVWNVCVIKPLDGEVLHHISRISDIVITIEEHSRIGGLGSAVAEVLAGLRQHPPLRRLGTGDYYSTVAAPYEELLKANHLDVDGIVKEVLDAIGQRVLWDEVPIC